MSDTDSERGTERSIPDSLSSLYQEVILDHYRRPRHKGELGGATHSVTMNNPLCGDVIELQLLVEGDRIEEARFRGRGCSISQAAASMMTETLEGLDIRDALALAEKFKELMHGDTDLVEDATLGDLRALAGVAKFPVRIKCALLGFNCLEELLEEDSEGAGGPGASSAGGS